MHCSPAIIAAGLGVVSVCDLLFLIFLTWSAGRSGRADRVYSRDPLWRDLCFIQTTRLCAGESWRYCRAMDRGDGEGEAWMGCVPAGFGTGYVT